MATATKPAAKKTTKPAAKKAPVNKVDSKKLDAALAAQLPVIAPKPSKVKPAEQAKPAAKKAAKKAEGDAPTKAELARSIYKKMKGKARKDVIQAFVSEAGLTVAGAATYYANCKRDAE